MAATARVVAAIADASLPDLVHAVFASSISHADKQPGMPKGAHEVSTEDGSQSSDQLETGTRVQSDSTFGVTGVSH